MNKKGSVLDIILWVVISFIVIMFLGMWFFMHNQLTVAFTSIPDTPGSNINISQAAEQTIGKVNSFMGPALHILTFMMMFAYALSIFISNYLIKGNPVFIFVHISITVIAVILAAIVSNVYEVLLTSSQISGTLLGFKGGSFIMLNLPLWTAVIGIFGIIFLFIGIIKDKEFRGGI